MVYVGGQRVNIFMLLLVILVRRFHIKNQDNFAEFVDNIINLLSETKELKDGKKHSTITKINLL